MAVAIREGVTLAAGSGDPETLNPGSDPSSGDILIAAMGESNTSGAPAGAFDNDSFGGTWTVGHSQVWATRRKMEVVVNDDWTTATGAIDANYSNSEDDARVLLVIEGADSTGAPDYEDAAGGDDGGPSITPTLTAGASDSGHVMIIQLESEATISTPTDWTKAGQITAPGGLRSFAVYTALGTLTDTTPTFTYTGDEGSTYWAGYFVAAASGDATVTLTVAVAAVASVPTITVNAGAVPAAATVAAVASVPGVTPNAGSTVALSASVDAVASVPGVTPNAGATVVLSSAVAAVASVPEVAVTTGSTATVTLSVAVVATAGVGTHTPNAGAAVSAVSVDATAGVGTLAITAGAIVSASTVAAVAAVGVVVVTTGVLATDTIILATYKQHTFTQTYEQPTFTGTHRQHTYTRTYEEGR